MSRSQIVKDDGQEATALILNKSTYFPRIVRLRFSKPTARPDLDHVIPSRVVVPGYTVRTCCGQRIEEGDRRRGVIAYAARPDIRVVLDLAQIAHCAINGSPSIRRPHDYDAIGSKVR